MTIPIHPLALAFPEMSAEEQADLDKSILDHGLRHPIVLLSHEGTDHILDGRNRYQACLRVKVPPMFRSYDVTIDGDLPVSFVADENLNRRNLTVGQRATIAAELAPYFAQAIAARQAAEKAAKAKEKENNKIAAAEKKATAAEVPPVEETLIEKLGRIHDQSEQSTFVEGAVSASNGEAVEANPHAFSHPKHDLWKEGWQAETARLIALDGSENVPEGDNVMIPDDDDIPIGTKIQPGATAAGMAADVTGVSEKSVYDAAALKESAPEEFKKVKEGEKSLHQAKQDAKAQGESISPYRAECADMLEAGFGDGFSEAIRNVTVLKTTAELDAFMKQTPAMQKEIIPFITKGWTVSSTVQFLKGEFTAGTTIGELMSYCNAKGGDVSIEVGGFTLTILADQKPQS